MAYPTPVSPPTLNRNDMDECLDISADGCEAITCSKSGMGYMFGGVRGTSGVVSGRWHFTVHFLNARPITAVDTEHLRTSMVARVGVSQLHTQLSRLGELNPQEPKNDNAVSLGLNSTGSVVQGSCWTPFAQPHSKVWASKTGKLTVLVDLSGPQGRIGFAVGGHLMGWWPQTLPKPTNQAEAWFPHLLLRNCRVRLDLTSPLPPALAALGVNEAAGPYQPWAEAVRVPSCFCPAPAPSPNAAPELVMMVGLPGSGKTMWARDYADKHKSKRFVILSPENVLDDMRVLSLRRPAVRRAFAERRRQADPNSAGGGGGGPGVEDMDDERDQIEQYYVLANVTYHELILRAIEHRHSIILDQTHVSLQSRLKRLEVFEKSGYVRRAALAAPMPALLEMLQAQSQEEGAPPVPPKVIAQLMSDFTAPRVGGPEGFLDVLLVHDPPRDPHRTLDTPEPPGQQLERVARQVVDRQRAMGVQWLQKHKAAAAAASGRDRDNANPKDKAAAVV